MNITLLQYSNDEKYTFSFSVWVCSILFNLVLALCQFCVCFRCNLLRWAGNIHECDAVHDSHCNDASASSFAFQIVRNCKFILQLVLSVISLLPLVIWLLHYIYPYLLCLIPHTQLLCHAGVTCECSGSCFIYPWGVWVSHNRREYWC